MFILRLEKKGPGRARCAPSGTVPGLVVRSYLACGLKAGKGDDSSKLQGVDPDESGLEYRGGSCAHAVTRACRRADHVGNPQGDSEQYILRGRAKNGRRRRSGESGIGLLRSRTPAGMPSNIEIAIDNCLVWGNLVVVVPS